MCTAITSAVLTISLAPRCILFSLTTRASGHTRIPTSMGMKMPSGPKEHAGLGNRCPPSLGVGIQPSNLTDYRNRFATCPCRDTLSITQACSWKKMAATSSSTWETQHSIGISSLAETCHLGSKNSRKRHKLMKMIAGNQNQSSGISPLGATSESLLRILRTSPPRSVSTAARVRAAPRRRAAAIQSPVFRRAVPRWARPKSVPGPRGCSSPARRCD